MKLGLGLPRARLNRDSYRFVKQAGGTHVQANLTNPRPDTPRFKSLRERHPGIAQSDPNEADWTCDAFRALRSEINDEGLELDAITMFEPAHWSDVLLDGPRRNQQMEHLKRIVSDMGRAGIPHLGYNFTLAGVWGRTARSSARGGAIGPAYHHTPQTPIPAGMVWNRVYDPDLYDPENPKEFAGQISHDELWERLARFLNDLLPVAEEAGVKLALHPDDPPLPTLRDTPRLVYGPDHYQRMIEINPSPSNGILFCVGTCAEMAEGDIYEMVDRYSRTGRIVFVHCRNVRGKVPHYGEVFIDEGDVDVIRVLRILHQNGFDGLLLPDHAPGMTCKDPWHASRAFTMGWLKAAMEMVGEEA